MLRTQAIRTSRNVPTIVRSSGPKVSVRRYTTEPGPRSQGSDNTLLYTAIGVAALGGAYFYFKSNPDGTADLKKKGLAHEEELRQKARESASSVRERSSDAAKEGERKYNQVKDGAQRRFDEAKNESENKIDDAKARGRSFVEDAKGRSGTLVDGAETKYDAYKDSARQSILHARDSTENLYGEARRTAEQRAAELRAEANKAGEEAKQGWLSWMGWGRSKIDDGEENFKQTRQDIEQRLDDDAQRASQRVSEGLRDEKRR